MNSRSSSLSSISDLFRPNNPRKLRSKDLSYTRLNVLKKEIQTDTHLIPLSKYRVKLYFQTHIRAYFDIIFMLFIYLIS